MGWRNEGATGMMKGHATKRNEKAIKERDMKIGKE
jgi:hypothetical protein